MTDTVIDRVDSRGREDNGGYLNRLILAAFAATRKYGFSSGGFF